MLTCSENPTLRYSLCLCDQEKDFRKNRSDVVMKKMVELLGEERGPQDIEEVCFGEIKISKFVQSLIPEFIYISPSGKSCTRCGALHFCDENLTNCVNNKTFLHIFSFDGLWFFITPRPLNWWDWLFLREWKSLKNIYETKTILPNLSKKCMHFCDWSCISDDAFNAFAAKMFIHRIHFVSLYMYL